MKSVTTNPFEKFDKDWAIVTVGNKDSYNGMTISWGLMGTLWSKPVVEVFIKPTRYTFQFCDKSDYFTVSFFDKQHKKALGIMGQKSGKDCDKIKLAGLTPKILDNCVTYEEAKETYVCKKILFQQIDRTKTPDFANDQFYTPKEDEPPHYMLIGELMN